MQDEQTKVNEYSEKVVVYPSLSISLIWRTGEKNIKCTWTQ